MYDALQPSIAIVVVQTAYLAEQVLHRLRVQQRIAHDHSLHVRSQPRSPPATGKVTPVMYEASSEARNRMATASSSGVPRRFIKVDATVCSMTSRSRALSRSVTGPEFRGMRRGGASIPPGATPQTRMPCAAYSKARQAVMAFTPPL